MLAHFGDLFLNVELEFDHQLDVDRLRRAVELTLRAEPVLGCRYVRHWLRPYWERAPIDMDRLLSIAASRDEFERFRIASLDEYANPQLRVCLLRDGGIDRLILKVSHQAADGGGCKHAAWVLSRIYTRLGVELDYMPAPNLAGTRSFRQVWRLIPWRAVPRIYLTYLRESLDKLKPFHSHTLPTREAPRREPVFVVRHLDEQRVSRLADFGRRLGATINDVLMAAFFRAQVEIAQWDGRSALRLMYTVDLRLHHLPGKRAEAVCNLSTIENVLLAGGPGATLEQTVNEVHEITLKRRSNYWGLLDYIGTMPTVKLLPFCIGRRVFAGLFNFMSKHGNAPNALTNMGAIDPGDVTFDKPAQRAWILAPCMYPPLLGVAVTGYQGRLTLSVGTYPPGVDPADVERLYDALERILPS